MIERGYWIVPSRILVFEVSGEVVLQDVHDLIEGMRTMIDADTETYDVDVLHDVSRVTSYNPETMNVRKLFGAVKKHERVRWNIIVNPKPNPVVDFVIRTVSQLFKTPLAILPTIDDAVAFIQTKTRSEHP
jgi:hypothetical protein